MDHRYQIEYENVLLRPLDRGDIENLRVWRNEPRNTKYLSKIPLITPEMQFNWFERYLNNRDEICFAIVENHDLNRMVGSLSLYEFMNDSCSFGKILVGDPDAHGRKVGLNATKAALKMVFGQLGIKTVKLHVYSDNLVAMKIYKTAGFRIIDEHRTEDGKTEFTMVKMQEV